MSEQGDIIGYKVIRQGNLPDESYEEEVTLGELIKLIADEVAL